MRVVVVRIEEVDVVRRDDADAELLAERAHPVDHVLLAALEVAEVSDALLRDRLLAGNRLRPLALSGRMKHHLKRVVVAEKVLVPARDLLSLRGIVPALRRVVEIVRDFARDAGARAVKSLVVFFEQGVIDARVVVEAVDVRLGDEPHEVVIADEILRVEAQVKALLSLVARRVIASRRDIRLDAENRLHALLAGLVVERLECEEIAVVRDRKRRHSEFLRLRDERLQLTLSVQQRIGGVKVEMDEIGHVSDKNEKKGEEDEDKGQKTLRERHPIGAGRCVRRHGGAVAAQRFQNPAESERQATLRRRQRTRRAEERDNHDETPDFKRGGHLPQAPAPETEPMILTIGRNIAMTIVPTTTASTMMSAGSIAAVMPATALSTSSS